MFARLIHFIEARTALHRVLLRIWVLFPPRVAGFLKRILTRSWVLGAVAVMLDDSVSPPRVLLVEHSYRRRGAWGLPGGALDSIPGDPAHPHDSASPDNIIEATLQREINEELGIEVKALRLLRTDAIPYVAEEPGPYRLTFYFRCEPGEGFAAFGKDLETGTIRARSPEILQLKLVPLDRLDDYDLFSPDARFLHDDLPRLLAASRRESAGEML